MEFPSSSLGNPATRILFETVESSTDQICPNQEWTCLPQTALQQAEPCGERESESNSTRAIDSNGSFRGFPSLKVELLVPLKKALWVLSPEERGKGARGWWCPSCHLLGGLQFYSVQSLSHVWLFATSWPAARQASLSITNSRSLLKLLSIKLVVPPNHLILCHPLLLPPSIFPSIRA